VYFSVDTWLAGCHFSRVAKWGARTLLIFMLLACIFILQGCCDCQPKADAGPLRWVARKVSTPYKVLRRRGRGSCNTASCSPATISPRCSNGTCR
jgi:hypothetical protein